MTHLVPSSRPSEPPSPPSGGVGHPDEASPGRAGPSEQGTGSRHRPVTVALATVVVAYVALTGLLVGAGALLVDDLGDVRRWDVSVNRWFVGVRDGWIDRATWVGSHLAETMTVVALGAVVVVVLWHRRDRWAATLIVVSLGLEVAVFLTTTMLVDRHRPPVHRLDGAPPTSSFPSGHTAAACALYLGLVVVLNRDVRSSVMRTLLIVLAALVPIVVGVSRLYRGMHQPTDVFAGALLGIACLAVAWRVSNVTDMEDSTV